MNKFFKNEKYFYDFRLGYVIFLLLYSVARQNVTALQPFLMNDILNYIVILFAGILFLWDILVFKNNIKTKYIWLLGVVFVLTLITSVVNFKYAFVENIKAAANMFIQFFVLYGMGKSLTKEHIDHEIKVIGSVLGAFWLVCVVISNIMYLFDISYEQMNYLWATPTMIPQGFIHVHEDLVVMRLWGIFVDPNFAATISIIVIFICIYLIYLTKRKWVKALHIVNILSQFVFIVLSNSRTALLSLLFVALVATWYFSWNFIVKINKGFFAKVFVKEILCVVMSVAVVVVCFAGYTLTQKGLPYLRYAVSLTQKTEAVDMRVQPVINNKFMILSKEADVLHVNSFINIVSAPENDDVVSLDREDTEIKNDISNGRFELWADGYKVFCESPIIGVGPRGYQLVAREINPEMAVAQKSVHNSFMELLMGNGALGFALVFAFFICCAVSGICVRKKGFDINFRVGIFLVCTLSGLVGGFFVSSLFYYLSGISIIVFLMLGYAMAYVNYQKEVDVKQRIESKKKKLNDKIKEDLSSVDYSNLDIKKLMDDYSITSDEIKKQS